MRYNAIVRITAAFIISTLLFIFLPCTQQVYAADEKIVVILDAGHGGDDGGSDKGTKTEKTYNLTIAKYMCEELSKNPAFEVHMTREDDISLLKLPRAMNIVTYNADVLISLHCNSNDSTKPNGSMAYVSVIDKFDASALAGKILDAISGATTPAIKRGDVEVRHDTGDALGVYYWNAVRQWDMPGESSLGTVSDYYSINTWSSKFGAPSIIVEHAYVSNKDDCAILDDDEKLKKIAYAEAAAVIDFYTGHTHQFPAEKTVDFPSSCTLTGTKSYRCTICGMKNDTEALAPAPDAHYWRLYEKTPATCTEDGSASYICQISYNLNDRGYDCTVHSYTDKLPAIGHDYLTVEDTAAAHGRDGHLRRECRNCGDVIEETRPGDPHVYEPESEKEATCTEDGGVTYKCTVCGDSYTEVSAKLGHDYIETERLDKTENTDGYVKYECLRCGETKTEVIHSCEHQFADRTESPAGCETDGRITETCEKCGYVREEVIPAAGHSIKVLLDTAPTCDKEGFYRAECTVCGEKISETRPATGHKYIIKEENGDTVTKVCSVCGDELTETVQRRSIFSIFKNPVAAVILSVIIIQIIAFPVIIVSHRRHRKRIAAPIYDIPDAPENTEESAPDMSKKE